MSTVPPWAQFALVVEHLADGVTVLDPTGRLVYANDAAARLGGFPSVDAMLRAPNDPSESFELFDQAGAPLSPDQLPARVALRDGNAELVVRMRDRRGGLDATIEIRSYAVYDEHRAPMFVVSVMRDLTSFFRQQAALADREHWLTRLHALTVELSRATRPEDVVEIALTQGREAFDGARACVFAVDDDDAPLRLIGHRGFPIDADCETLPRDRRLPMSEAAASGEVVFIPDRATFMSRFPDAASSPMFNGVDACVAIPMRVGGRTGGVVAYSIAAADRFSPQYAAAARTFGKELGSALERTTTRAQLERAHVVAHNASDAKSSFLAVLSHELRTPINAILGFTDLLQMGVVGEPSSLQAGYLQRIRRSTEHMLGLIDDVVDMSKIEAGFMTLALELRSMHEVVMGAVSLVRQQALDAGLTLDVDCPAHLMYHGDPLRVRQILLNLLENAVHFTPSGGAIRVSCTVHNDIPGTVAFAVEDTGIGIAPANLDRIFEPFVRLDPLAGDRGRQGSGLGLSISQRLAHMMEGEILVESRFGSGSRFMLTLPMRKRQQPAI